MVPRHGSIKENSSKVPVPSRLHATLQPGRRADSCEQHRLSVVSQLVRFYSHTICPHQLTRPEVPLLLALRGLRFFATFIPVVAAVGKWESRFGISKGRWERWETGFRFSTASTVPPFPRPSRVFLQDVSRGLPSAS